MIEVKNLEFTYQGNRDKTIKGLDFTVAKGEIFGFLGPSGAGKSTTQNILIGLLKNYRGRLRVMGKELKEMGGAYYEKIGVAFEVPNFYTKFTALENLSLFRSFYASQTEEPRSLLAMVGLEKDGDTRVSNFSKGMRMRLNFCRAFLNRPDLLYLDEPTAGLDPVNARKVKDLILSAKAEGKTVFLTTHNMNVAEEICDRVAFIVEGRIELIDSPRELMVRRGQKKVRLEYRENGSIGTADFPLKGIGRNRDFLQLLQEKDVERMHTQEATLESIFIEVTGRSLT
jgi:fluoroquinolone transport system ATP-binding protein